MSTRRFLFVGDNLSLDFLNTVLTVRGKPVDLIASESDLADWWEAAAKRYDALAAGPAPSVTRALFEEMRELRAALQAEFKAAVERGHVTDAVLDALNDRLRQARPMLKRQADATSMQLVPSSVGQEMPIAIALSAAELVTQFDIKRLRKCVREDCTVLFLDHTKNAKRRFCTTLCFDQVRAREKRRRDRSRA